MTPNVVLRLVLVLALVIGACLLAIRHYQECRAHGFSRLYCAVDR